MKAESKLLLLAGVTLLVAAGIWFSDVPIGYRQFHEACDAEAGLRQFSPLDKGVGWETPSNSQKEYLAYTPHIKFVRSVAPVTLADRNPTAVVDYTYKAGDPLSGDSYAWILANAQEMPEYKVSFHTGSMPGAVRLHRTYTEVIDARNGTPVLRDTIITFDAFRPEASIVGIAKMEMCPDLRNPDKSRPSIPRNVIFKN